MGAGIRESGPGILEIELRLPHWHKTVMELSSAPNGVVDFESFQAARYTYEENMFQAALESRRARCDRSTLLRHRLHTLISNELPTHAVKR